MLEYRVGASPISGFQEELRQNSSSLRSAGNGMQARPIGMRSMAKGACAAFLCACLAAAAPLGRGAAAETESETVGLTGGGSLISPATSGGFGEGLARTWRNSLRTVFSASSGGAPELDGGFSGTSDYNAWLRGRGNRAVNDVIGGTLDYVGLYLTGTDADGNPRFGFIRTIDLDFSTDLGERRWQAGVSALGPLLLETDEQALVWQVRGYAAGEDAAGANAGIIYRRAYLEALIGLNAFLDYEQHGDYDEEFVRYSVGGEVRSEWVDAYANSYRAITGSDRDEPDQPYTRDGLDIGAQVQVPANLRALDTWGLSGGLTYYEFSGEYGDADDTGLRYNIALSPKMLGAGHRLRLEFEYDVPEEGDSEWGGQVSYQFVPGEPPASSGSGPFDPQEHFFDPVRREYAQRISVPSGVVGLASVDILGSGILMVDLEGAAPRPYDADIDNPFDYTRKVGLETDAVVTVGLHVASAWTVTIHESTSIDFQERGTAVALASGTLYVNRNREITMVSTPIATISLGGTEFTVSHAGSGTTTSGTTTVRLLEGEIDILVDKPMFTNVIAKFDPGSVIVRKNGVVQPREDGDDGTRLFHFATRSTSAAEGSTAFVTVSLSAAATERVAVTVSVSGGDAEVAIDWSIDSGCTPQPVETCVVQFEATDASKVIGIAVIADRADENPAEPSEGDERSTFQLVGDAPDGYSLDGDSFELFIVDDTTNTAPEWTLNAPLPAAGRNTGYSHDFIARGNIADAEGDSITCRHVGGRLPETFEVTTNCMLTSSDVRAPASTYTFSVVASDGALESTAMVTLQVVSAPLIQWSEIPTAPVSEGSAFGGKLTITPALREAATVTIGLPSAEDLAFAGTCSGSICVVTLAVGADTFDVNFSAISGDEKEAAEEVSVTFVGQHAESYRFGDGIVITIAADPSLIAWSIIPIAPVSEGDVFGGTLTITPPLQASATVTIGLETDQDLAFAGGGCTGTICVVELAGGAETFNVQLSAVLDAAEEVVEEVDVAFVGQPSERYEFGGGIAITIAASENLGIHMALSEIEVAEGGSQTVGITLFSAPPAPVSLTISRGTGSGEDWSFECTSVAASGNTCVVGFNAGITLSSLTVIAVKDANVGEDETFPINLFPPYGWVLKNQDGSALVTQDARIVRVLDVAPEIEAIPIKTLVIGDAVDVDLIEYISEPDDDAFTCTGDSSLVGGLELSTNCVLSAASLALPAGAATVAFTVVASYGAEVIGMVTVEAVSTPRIQWSDFPTVQVSEGSNVGGTLTITPPLREAATVTIGLPSAEDLAFAGTCSGSLCVVTLAVGAETFDVGFSAVSDSIQEEAEAVGVAFVGLPAESYIFGAGISITIAADPSLIEWSAIPAIRVFEGEVFGGTLTITPPLQASATVTLGLETDQDLAFAGGGCAGSLCVVELAAGAITFNVQLSAVLDAAEEVAEAVSVAFVGQPAEGFLFGEGIAITIEASDNLGIHMALSDIEVAEGGSQTVGITLFTLPADPLSLTISRGTGASEDWSFSGCSRLADSGNTCIVEFSSFTPGVFAVTAVKDAFVGENETFSITLRPPYGWVLKNEDGSALETQDHRIVRVQDVAPEIDAIPIKTLVIGDAVGVDLSEYISEPDDDAFTCTGDSSLAGGLELSTNCVLSAASLALPAGAATLAFTVVASYGAEVIGTVTLEVAESPLIRWSEFPTVQVSEGSVFGGTLTITSPLPEAATVTIGLPTAQDLAFAGGGGCTGSVCVVELAVGAETFDVQMSAVFDPDMESAEPVSVSFVGQPPEGYIFGADIEITVAASGNLGVHIATDQIELPEGRSHTVGITLFSAAPADGLSVTLSRSAGGVGDFSFLCTSVSADQRTCIVGFSPGATISAVTVTAHNDARVGENFFWSFVVSRPLGWVLKQQDGNSPAVANRIRVHVLDVAPAIGAIPIQDWDVGEAVTVDLSEHISEPDDDPFTCVGSSSLAGGLELSTSCVLSAASVSLPVGETTIPFTVRASYGARVSGTVTVQAVADRPTFASTLAVIELGVGVNIDLSGNVDADGAAFTCHAEGALPRGLSLGSASCMLTATSLSGSSGLIQVTVFATRTSDSINTRPSIVEIVAMPTSTCDATRDGAQNVSGAFYALKLSPAASCEPGDAIQYWQNEVLVLGNNNRNSQAHIWFNNLPSGSYVVLIDMTERGVLSPNPEEWTYTYNADSPADHRGGGGVPASTHTLVSGKARTKIDVVTAATGNIPGVSTIGGGRGLSNFVHLGIRYATPPSNENSAAVRIILIKNP